MRAGRQHGPQRGVGAWSVHIVRVAAAAVALVASVASAQTTARYSVTMSGTIGGHLVRSADGKGNIHVDYSYRDNGRGPDIVEDLSIDASGNTASYRVRGKSTFGGEIREDFARDQGRVQWTSLVDRGQAAADPGALYLPIEYSPEIIAHLVRSVWATADRSAPAIPAGKFTVERVAERTVRSAGGQAQVALYALTGSNLTPDYVWLRDDASMALFAVVFPEWRLIEEGFEAEGDALVEVRRQAQSERLRRLAERLAKPLPGLTVIRRVRWFDAHAATMRGPADVYLFGGRIAAILPAGSAGREVDRSIDGAGRALLPGLFDMHSHLYAEEGILNIAGGVTSIRDMGNNNENILDLKARYDAGSEIGPRVTPAGFIEGRSPFSSSGGFIVASLDEARRAVDWYAQRGYHQVKLYNSIKPEWAQPLAAYAHQQGLRVSGHVPAFMRAEEAVDAGYDEINHINQVMLNFFVKRTDDTRTLLRFSLVGDEAHKVSLDGPRVRDFLAKLRKRGTVVDPTVSTFEAAYLQRNGQPDPSFAMIAEHLPVAVRRAQLSNSTDVNDQNAQRYGASYAKMLELVGRMHRAGIPLVAGTDNFAGFTLHRELEQYVRAGIPAAEVLRIATLNGARYSGTLSQTGTIERGKLADLILVDGDPASKISDIRKISLVIKGATAYAPDEMYEAIGIRPFVPSAPIVNEKPKP